MATAITEDFVTKNGIVIQGTSVVTSSTGQSNALQVGGGAAIAANIIVGTTATIGDKLTVGNDTYINGKVTATGFVSILDSTAATTSSVGALVVSGGIYAGNNLIVSSINASTATITSNALYVAGGASFGKSLWVVGPARFDNDVVFNGATTYVYSTNTVYTDNLIELHTPSNSTEWLVDDGKDIGLRFHYFSSTGSNAALVLANDTKYLEWYGTGAESTTGTFGSAVYGTFKTGYVKLTSTDTAISTITGALQTVGGIGIGGAIYGGADISGATLTGRNLTQGRIPIADANGQLIDNSGLTYNTSTNYISARVEYASTSTNLANGSRGSIPYQSSTGTTDFVSIGPSGYVLLSAGGLPSWSSFDGVTSGRATTASNIAFGADMQIPFQNGEGSTAFDQNLRYEYNSYTFRSVNAIFTGTTNSQSTNTGALQVVGGVGIGGGLVVGGTTTATNAYISNNLTASAITATNLEVGNIGWGSVYLTQFASVFAEGGASVSNVLLQASANNLASGIGIGTVGGPSLYSSGGINFTTNRTLRDRDTPQGGNTFMSLSTSGVLTLSGTVASTSTTTGALTVAGGVGIRGDLYTGGTIYGNLTGSATTATNLSAGTAGQLPYQTAPGVTSFVSTGTAGNVLVSNGTGVPTYNNTLTLTGTTVATSTSSGALQVAGGAGIGGDVWVGGNGTILGDLEVRGGDITTNQTTFNLLNATASTINFAGAGTAITIGTTTGYTEIKNATTLTNTTAASSTSTGALQVRGGAGIGGSLYVGGATVISTLNATLTTVTNLTVSGTAGVAGVASFTEGSNATLVGNGALKVTGGVSISRDFIVGGSITSGVTAAATSGTTVSALFSNNTLLATYTSGAITGSTQVNLDTFSSTVYRSARYFVQIVDGINVHISELSVFHDGTAAYLSEYGISTNHGQLGVFDASWSASNVTIKFTPNSATAMTIKMVRTTLTI